METTARKSWLRISMLWMLAIGLALACCGGLAEKTITTEVIEETVVLDDEIPTLVDQLSSNELAAGYINQFMPIGASVPRVAYRIGEDLDGADRNLYDLLVPEIQKIAAGQEASTEMAFPVASVFTKTRYTAEELGVDAILSGGSFTEAAETALKAALNSQLDSGRVVKALLADYPYDLYWYDKVVGTNSGYTYSGNSNYIEVVDDYTVKMRVSQDYAVKTQMSETSYTIAPYTVDTDLFGGAVSAALENSQAILEEYEGMPNYERLMGYNDRIRGLTEYNHDAAQNSPPYGDPWQLIWVFDGNPETKVVCEGYSKAFKYLNDRSSGSAKVICATGEMDGGPHMWNIVTMEDGLNYLTDVTNNHTGDLFLAGYDEEISGGYQVSGINYVYDTEIAFTQAQLTLADTDYIDSRPDYLLEVSKTDAWTNETIAVSGYAKNATAVELRIRKLDDGEESVLESAVGTTVSKECNFEETGTYEIKLYAQVDGNEWAYTNYSEQIAVSCEQIDLLALVPGIVTQGEDFEIILPDRVTTVRADVYDDNFNGNHVYWLNRENGQGSEYDYYNYSTGQWMALEEDSLHSDNGNIVVPGAVLQPFHTYHIDLRISGPGIKADDIWDVKFTAVNGEDDNISISVTVNDNSRNLYVNEYYNVRAYASGAKGIRAYDGSNWHYAFGDTLEETWQDGWSGKRYLYAQAVYGDTPWTEEDSDWDKWNKDDWDFWNYCGTSNIIELTFEAQGQMEAPQIQVLTENIVLGGFVEVKVVNPLEGAWYNGALGWWDHESDDSGSYGRWFNMDENNIIRIPVTGMIDAGEHAVLVNCGGLMGQEGNRAMAAITVANAGIQMNFDKTTAENRENIFMIAQVPNATAVAVTCNEEEGQTWDDFWKPWEAEGCSVECDWLQFDHVGTYTLKLYAKFGDSEDWTWTNVSGEITVTGVQMDLSTLIPATVTAGQDFEIVLPEKVTSVRANVFDDSFDGRDVFWMNWEEGRNSDYNYYKYDEDCWMAPDGDSLHADNGNIVIPGIVLQKNHTYHIDLEMHGQGFDADDVGDVKFTAVAVEETYGDISLTVTVEDDSRPLYINEHYQVRAYAEGASAIRVFDGWNWQYRNGDTLEDSWNDGTEGTRYLYAQAYYGDAPWNAEGFDWNEWDWNAWNWDIWQDQWSGLSNTVEMTYVALGQMDPPEIRVLTENVNLGGFVEIEVLQPEEGAWYQGGFGWWNDEDGSNDFNAGRYEIDADHIIRIPVMGGAAGEQTVLVEVGGIVGLRANRAHATVTVADAGAQMNFAKTELETQENIFMTVYVPGATAMAVTINEESGWTWENVWRVGEYWEGNSGDCNWFAFDTHGTYVLKLYAQYESSDEWVFTDVSQTITVTSVQMDLSTLIPATVTAGQDFVIELPEKVTNVWANVYDDNFGGNHVFWMNWEEGRNSDWDYYDYNTEDWIAPEGDSLHSESGNIVIPGAVLLANHTYHIDMSMHGQGFEADDVHNVRFTAVNGEDENISLTVTAADEGRNPYVNENHSATAHAEGAKAIRLYDGDNWQYEAGDTLERTWSNGAPGTYQIYAQAYYGNETPWNEDGFDWNNSELEWGGMSEVISLQVDSLGQVSEFTFALEKATAERGEPLNVTFNGSEHADHYWIDIERQYGEEEWDWVDHTADVYTETGASGTAKLYTAKLEAGTYRVFGQACGVGYEGRDTEPVILTITEPEDGGIVFLVDAGENNTIQTGGEIGISVYAPGAHWIDVLFDAENDENWRDNRGGDAYVNRGTIPYWAPGTYQLVARAWYPVYETDEQGNLRYDEDDNPIPVYEKDEDGNTCYDDQGNPIEAHYFLESDAVTITVTASGTLEIEQPELPLYLAPDSGLDFTVQMPEGGAWMNLNINVQNQDGSGWDRPLRDYHSEGRDIHVTLPWNDLAEAGIEAGMTLNINVNGGATGKEVVGWNRSIPVIDLQDGEQPEAFISFDETEADVLDALVNQEIRVTVQAPEGRTPEEGEGESIQTIRFFDGYNFWPDESPNSGDKHKVGCGIGEPGTRVIYALVTYTPWDEAWNELDYDPRAWYPTNVLQVNATANGSAGEFDITDWTESVPRGGKILVTLSPSENADNYWLHGDGYEIEWRWTDEENLEASIATTNLWPGEYRFRAGANAEGLVSYDTPWRSFTVTEPVMGDDRVKIIVEKTKLYLNENADISILAPGAVRIGFICDGNTWHLDDDGNYMWGDEPFDSWYNNDLNWGESWDVGEHILQGAAQFEEGGEWVYTEPVTVTVRVRGSLEAPVITAPAIASSAEDLTFTVSGLDQGEWWNVDVWDEDNRFINENGDSEAREIAHWDRDKNGGIPAVFFVSAEHLPAGHRINIHAHVHKDGYLNGDSNVNLLVTGEASENITFTVNGGTEDIAAWPSSKNLVFRVTAPGSEAIRMWNGYDWWYIPNSDDCCDNGIYEFENCYNEPGDYPFAVQATYTQEHPDWDGDWGDFHWEDMAWTDTSNVVTVTITSKGRLAAPHFTLNKTDLAWGEDLIATVTDEAITTRDGQPVEDESWYFVNLSKLVQNEGEPEPWFEDYRVPMDLYVDENHEVRIPTWLLEGDGTYCLQIGADAEGWELSTHEQYFDVGPEADVSEEPYTDFHVSRTNLEAQEQTMLYVYQTGAEWYDVEIRKNDDPDWTDGRESGGPALVQNWGADQEGTYTLTAYAHGVIRDANGEPILDAEDQEQHWHDKVGEVTVTVTAIGDLDPIVIHDVPTVLTLEEGAEINGSFDPVEHADFYTVEMHYCPEDGADWVELERREIDAAEAEEDDFILHLSTDELRGGRHRIWVYAAARNYNQSSKEVWIQVLEPKEETISVTVNDSTEDITNWPAGKQLTVKVTAPGASVVRMLNENNDWDYRYGEGLDENGVAYYDRYYNGGDYTIVAQASYDRNEDGSEIDWETFNWENFDFSRDMNWTGGSNRIALHVNSNGPADEPDFTVPERVVRGQLLNVTINGLGDADSPSRGTEVYAWLQNEDRRDVEGGIGRQNLTADDFPLTFSYPTGDLEPGTYRVLVNSTVEGYDITTREQLFEVVEPEGEDPFIFEVEEDLHVNLAFSISAYTPGAGWFDIVVTNTETEEEMVWGPYPGNSIQVMDCGLDAGTYDIYAIAHLVDKNGEEIETPRSETVTRTVTSLGNFDAPVISSTQEMMAGEDFSFTVSGLERADWWWVEVRDQDEIMEKEGDEYPRLVAEWNADDGLPEVFTVDGSELAGGHEYAITAWAIRGGYDPGESTEEFVAGGKLAAPEILDVVHGGTIGRDVVATVAKPVSGAVMNYVSLTRKTENGHFEEIAWEGIYHNMNNVLTVLGFAVDEPGIYRIETQALTHELWEDVSKLDSDKVVYEFTLADADLPEIEVELSADEFNYGEVEAVTYTIPGAEAVTDHWCGYDLATGEEIGGVGLPTTYVEGDTATISASLIEAAARHEMTFWGRINGVWSKAAVKNIIVNALGTLEAPAVTFNGEPVSDTLTLSLDEPMILNITGEENTWIYYVLNRYMDGEYEWIDQDDSRTPEITLDLSETGLVPGATYELSVYCNRDGYSQGKRVIELNVVNLEKCGENAYYTLEDGVLTIDGSGPMYDYPKDGSWAPWRWNSNDIHEVVINGDITSLGNEAFRFQVNMTDAYISPSVRRIGENAFTNCTGLQDVWFAGTERMWNAITVEAGNEALDNATIHFELEQILNLPAALTTIESEAFAGLTGVDAIRIPATVTDIADDAFSGSDIVILTTEGSPAAAWAEEHDVPFLIE